MKRKKIQMNLRQMVHLKRRILLQVDQSIFVCGFSRPSTYVGECRICKLQFIDRNDDVREVLAQILAISVSHAHQHHS